MTIHVHSSFLFSRVLCFADLDLKFESIHVILCESHCKYFFCTNFACFSCPPGGPGGRQLIRYCKKLSESYRLSFLFQQVPHSRPHPSARGVVSLVFCHSCTQVFYTIMTFTGGIYIYYIIRIILSMIILYVALYSGPLVLRWHTHYTIMM